MNLESQNPVVMVVLFVAGVFILRKFAWVGWLFVFPDSLKIEVDAPPSAIAIPLELERIFAQLGPLDFVLLGSLIETNVFGRTQSLYVFENRVQQTMLSISVDGKVVALSMSEKQCVMSCNFRRVCREETGRYWPGAMEGLQVDRLIKAHVRRLSSVMTVNLTLECSAENLRRWHRDFARIECRIQNAVGFLWALTGVLLVSTSLVLLFQFI